MKSSLGLPVLVMYTFREGAIEFCCRGSWIRQSSGLNSHNLKCGDSGYTELKRESQMNRQMARINSSRRCLRPVWDGSDVDANNWLVHDYALPNQIDRLAVFAGALVESE